MNRVDTQSLLSCPLKGDASQCQVMPVSNFHGEKLNPRYPSRTSEIGLVLTANPNRKNHDSIQPIIGKGLAMSSISVTSMLGFSQNREKMCNCGALLGGLFLSGVNFEKEDTSTHEEAPQEVRSQWSDRLKYASYPCNSYDTKTNRYLTFS
jgi:hypothetical protein